MQKVTVDPDKLNQYAESFNGEVDVEFPELREFLGLGEEELPVITIKAASLDDQLRAQALYEQTAVMAIKMMEWAKRGDQVDPVGFKKLTKELTEPMNNKTLLEISLFHRCVVKPEFTMRQSVRISEALPEVVNRVAARALELSSLQRINT
jgi:hypothetical protein